MTPHKRIVLAVTSEVSLRLMTGFPEYLAERGWDVHVVSSGQLGEPRIERRGRVTYHRLPMERNPAPWRDVLALGRWIRLLSHLRPAVVSVGTPKAALLGGLAACLTRVPHRTLLLRGMRHESETGYRRTVLRFMERISSATAHHVVAVSHSLRELALSEGIASEDKISVVGRGSSNGVDLRRFAPAPVALAGANLHIAQDRVPTIGFIGRLHPDKGIDLLHEATALLAARKCPGRLLVVGQTDSSEAGAWMEKLRANPFPTKLVGFVHDVAPVLRSIDVLCLPTKREGFPNVVLEAAASGVPTVATRATGVVDAIEHGRTGFVCQSRRPAELADALECLLRSPGLRRQMGANARAFVEQHYRRDTVWHNLDRYYSAQYARTLKDHDRAESQGPYEA